MNRLIWTSPDGSTAAWELFGQRCVVFRAGVGSAGQPLSRPRSNTMVCDAVLRALLDGDALVQLDGRLYLRRQDRWVPVHSEHILAGELTHVCPVFRLLGQADLTHLQLNNNAAEADGDRVLLRQLAAFQEPSFTLYDSPKLYQPLVAQGHREGVPEIAGFLSHPIVLGTPRRRWVQLQPAPLPYDPPGARNMPEAYPHLRALFSCFPLEPWAHAALHMALFGCFTAASLDYERPILWVDSWRRGRGKSEVARVFSILLDGEDESISISGRKTDREVITSHLIRGRRVLTLQNLDGMKDYNNQFLVSLATDGGVGDRAKFGREASYFRGIMLTLNAIYGAVSLHQDFVSRVWRVELPGPPQALTPRPIDYANQHRQALLAELLLAGQRCANWICPVCDGGPGRCTCDPQYSPRPYLGYSRAKPFERAAAALYREVFGLTWDEVFTRVQTAMLQANALRPDAVQSLYSAHPDSFEAPDVNVTGRGHNAPPLPESWAGITALGHIFNGKEWS